jgi:hypothetical protein
MKKEQTYKKTVFLCIFSLIIMTGAVALVQTDSFAEDLGITYTCPYTHRHLLLLYPSTNVIYVKDGVTKRFMGTMSYSLRNTLINSFKNLPNLIEDGSAGATRATYEIKIITRSITHISKIDTNYWVSYSDIQSDLAKYAPPGKYDAVHVVWYSGPVPAYWGLGGVFVNNGTTTFSSLIAGQDGWWTQGQALGEPFLHEWLHAICRFFGKLGYPMPQLDADGATLHEYVHSNIDGWMDYYRDLMRGLVWEPNLEIFTGISRDAWCEGPPR